MGLNHKIIKSVKQATIARFFGCNIELLHDAANPGKVLFRATPGELAEDSIRLFEAGELLPGRAILDGYSNLYREIRDFLRQYKKQSNGKVNTAGE
ncbi:MAG: hypothetical protein HIU83_15175 [Proteobacteria bacterium]|nr:hypothetical protein [Pseudomonadota bacterium]